MKVGILMMMFCIRYQEKIDANIINQVLEEDIDNENGNDILTAILPVEMEDKKGTCG